VGKSCCVNDASAAPADALESDPGEPPSNYVCKFHPEQIRDNELDFFFRVPIEQGKSLVRERFAIRRQKPFCGDVASTTIRLTARGPHAAFLQ